MEDLPRGQKIPFWGSLSVGIDRVAGWLWWVLIGWWFNAPRARREEYELAVQVREMLPFLFEEYGAEIVPNPDRAFGPVFGGALVTVALGHMLLLFARGRGEFSVLLCPRREADDWRNWKYLQDVLRAIDRPEDGELSPQICSLRDAARVLQAELPRLQEATSNEQWDLVKRKVNALRPPLIRIR